MKGREGVGRISTCKLINDVAPGVMATKERNVVDLCGKRPSVILSGNPGLLSHLALDHHPCIVSGVVKCYLLPSVDSAAMLCSIGLWGHSRTQGASILWVISQRITTHIKITCRVHDLHGARRSQRVAHDGTR